MRRSYLEIIFRHRLLVVAPVLLAFALGAGFALMQPRKYQAIASVWADSPVTTDSTIGTTGGAEPPAAGQQALFGELLATRGFLLDVLEDSPGGSRLEGQSVREVDRALARARRQIGTYTPGPHILSITVNGRTPEVATRTAEVLVEKFLADQADLLDRRSDAEVALQRRQLDVAEESLAAARAALGARPSGPGTPAQAALDTAQQQRLEAQRLYDRAVAKGGAVTADGLVYLKDPPDTAARLSRLKLLALGAGGGGLAGLVVSVLVVMLLMARDRSIHTERELESLLGKPVLGSIDDFGRHGWSAPTQQPRGEMSTGGRPS